MRGIKVASYVVIANMTMSAGICAARAQQAEAVRDATSQGATYIDTPEAQSVRSVRGPNQNWLLFEEPEVENAGKRFFSDQKEIWTSPFRLRGSDAEWLVPVIGITTGTILTDTSFSKSLSNNSATLQTYKDVRTGSVAALAGVSAGLYLWSLRTHDPHQRETGLLASEAILDSLAVTESLKFVAGRERPNEGNGEGAFLQGGRSFPSNESAAAWSAASVLAHEYPGPLTKLFVYGLASAVSFSSVGSKEHFPTDVFIGSGIGWLVGEYVYRAHHDANLGGSSWSPVGEFVHKGETGPTSYPGSTNVPLDSWVYPAFDRLAALGLLSGGFQGTRPWSRERCAQLLLDADQALENSRGFNVSLDSQIRALMVALHHEFAREEETFSGPNRSAQIESIYSRVLSASGTVLDDGYHFGQTYAYDYGRPFREGTNFIAGASASATYGSLYFYLSGEYQHSPSSPVLSSTEIQFITDRDKAAPASNGPFASINDFRIMDAYAGINLHGWQISFGNQSLSWGPGAGGSLLLSDNAAPFPMLRLSSAEPVEVPLLSSLLGPFNFEQFFGRVDGQVGPSQPWIYGQKISFKPLRSVEFAYGRTTLIGGTGRPLTGYNFVLSVFGRVDPVRNSVPGDSRTSVEWTWRLPKMHDWVTFYGELEDDDDPIPLQNLTKSVLRPGIYLPRLPLLPKWDLHFEWTSSTTPGRASFQNHGDLNYWNLDYTRGYTNDGNLMGNIVGREGVTLQAWTSFWISPRRTLDFSWKQSRVLKDYIPGGGKWQDVNASYSVTAHSGIYLKGFLQFEHIESFPLLFPGSRNNLTAGLELGFLPPWSRYAGASNPSRSANSNPTMGGPSR